MKVKEKAMRFSPTQGDGNAKNSSEVPTSVNQSPSNPKDTQPLWLVNKKPTSLVVNYKTNQGQKMEKISFGLSNKKQLSPKNIISEGDKHPETENREKSNKINTTQNGKHNIVTIFSE